MRRARAVVAHVLGAAALAAATGVGAVALPARRALGLPIRAALAGRRPPEGGARGWLATAVVALALAALLLAFGAGVDERAGALALVAGSVLAAVGLAAAAPWLLVRLAAGAARLPLAWRLTARDAGRAHARTAPAVCAVMAGMALAVLQASLAASVERRYDGAGAAEQTLLAAALWACLATGLVVVFVATALASAEAAGDLRVLREVGASPGLARRLVATRAGYLAWVGGALAVPAGLVPAAGLLALADVPLELAFPWRQLAVALVALPLLAYAGTWCAAALWPARPSARRA